MKEQLSIMQMIAEEKDIKKKIIKLINNVDLITYYQKNRPFVGARSAEEQEKDQKEKVQAINDLLKRFYAIKKAHIKANRETMVIVPEELTLFDLLAGKTPGKESISIAEAINRKHTYSSPKGVDLESIAQSLHNNYVNCCSQKAKQDAKAKEEVNDQLAKRFPIDSKNNWSQEKYNEVKKQLEAETEVIRIDPYDFIGKGAIQEFNNLIQRYLMEIDVIISQANAATIVEIEY